MRHEHIHLRDFAPMPGPVFGRTDPERAAIERSDWRSPQRETLHFNALIDQHRRIREQGAKIGVSLEEELMVSRNNNLVTMGQLSQPRVEIFHGTDIPREHREVAGVDEDISVRHVNFAMEFVGVGQEY
jgi:hypothetical protein